MKRTDAAQAKRAAIGGLTAALYVILTLLSHTFGLASGAVQVRLSEALCIMPVFTPYAIPGLTVGCILSNLITGCTLPDVIFGSIATLLGAIGTYALRKKRGLFCIPPVLSNTLIVPLVLCAYTNSTMAYPIAVLTVLAGEIVSCVLLGQFLYSGLNKVLKRII